MKKFLLTIAIVIVGLFTFSACQVIATDYGTLTIQDVAVEHLGTAEIQPIFSNSEYIAEISYEFEGENIAIVGNTVTGLVAGSQTVVTAKTEHHSVSFKVIVGQPIDYGTLTIEDISLVVGDEADIVGVFSNELYETQIVYSYEGENIVISEGKVKGLVKGSVTEVTATTEHHSATFNVEVVGIKDELLLNQGKFYVDLNGTKEFLYTADVTYETAITGNTTDSQLYFVINDTYKQWIGIQDENDDGILDYYGFDWSALGRTGQRFNVNDSILANSGDQGHKDGKAHFSVAVLVKDNVMYLYVDEILAYIQPNVPEVNVFNICSNTASGDFDVSFANQELSNSFIGAEKFNEYCAKDKTEKILEKTGKFYVDLNGAKEFLYTAVVTYETAITGNTTDSQLYFVVNDTYKQWIGIQDGGAVANDGILDFYGFDWNTNGRSGLFIDTNKNILNNSGELGYKDGKAHFSVAVLVKDNVMYLFVDGKLAFTQTNVPEVNVFNICSDSANGDFDVRFNNQQLSTATQNAEKFNEYCAKDKTEKNVARQGKFYVDLNGAKEFLYTADVTYETAITGNTTDSQLYFVINDTYKQWIGIQDGGAVANDGILDFYGFDWNTNGRSGINLDVNQSILDNSGELGYKDGKAHFSVAVLVKGNVMYLFVDGKLAFTQTNVPEVNVFNICSDSANGDFDVRFNNQQLSTSSVNSGLFEEYVAKISV